MKKALLIIGLVLAVVALASAGGKQEEMQPEGQEGVNIRFATTTVMEADRKDTALEIMRRFEESHPDIKLDVIGIPFEQLPQQTQIMIAGGNAPDVIQLNAAYTIPFVAMEALIDLKPYYEQDELDRIPTGLYQDSTIEGKLYSRPWYLGTISVLAWKDLLVRAGLPVQIPETWTQFKSAVDKISDLGEGIYGFGARTSKTQNSAMWFLPVMWGHGGKLEDEQGQVTFYSEGTVNALDWYRVIGATEQTPVGMGTREVRNLFVQGKVGFIFDGPWMKGIIRAMSGEGETVDDDYIVGMFPVGVDGKRYAIQNSPTLSVATQSKAPEQSVTFIKYLTQNREITSFYYDQQGFPPADKELLSDPKYADDSFTKAFIDNAEFARNYASTHQHYPTALEFIAIAMQEALLGGDPEKAAKKAHENIKTVFGQ